LNPARLDSLRWPVGIALALLIVIAVNVVFVYVAVRGADEVAPSYVIEPR
jgi:hypothetical protein